MSRRFTPRRRRPIVGGALLGALIALALFVMNIGVSLAVLPWVVVGAAVGGGALGGGVKIAAGDNALAALFEPGLSAIGEFLAAGLGFVGDLFSGSGT
ncbi:hypothetical protein [Maricaulis sp.]|uniref:hypothetical protein n=1 Tax=Maricaulis sp. TaxID=1486257 RepID=UPI002B27705E|nr:hypothetical protein [Maricaulis sp.]